MPRADATTVPDRVALTFFNDPGCPACEYVENNILPTAAQAYPDIISVDRRDVNVMSNYMELVRWQEHFDDYRNEPVYILVAQSVLLSGLDDIKTGLHPAINAAAESAAPLAAAPPPDQSEAIERLLVRFRRFTIPAVMLAGFIDGLNPCAISALVFFVSMTAVAGLRGRRLWVVGACFCGASFLTNTILGFGLLAVLRQLTAFKTARNILEIAILALLTLFAGLSLLDAWRYRASGRPGDVILQTPAFIKNYLHRRMRRLTDQNTTVIVTAFTLGILVTLLESVCTGQVYVPTLVLVIKSGRSILASTLLLLLYNFMFILPLATVFILICRGLEFQSLLNWSRRNVVVSKIMLATLFLLLAAMIFILRVAT